MSNVDVEVTISSCDVLATRPNVLELAFNIEDTQHASATLNGIVRCVPSDVYRESLIPFNLF